jgi:hypothetical protein
LGLALGWGFALSCGLGLAFARDDSAVTADDFAPADCDLA